MVAFGRHIEHDPVSRSFPTPFTQPLVRTVLHRHVGPVLDQDDVGACTFFALAQACNTRPLRSRRPLLTSAHALHGYSLATVLDEFPGQFPPSDTGSSGLGAAKAAAALGHISGYSHAFTRDQRVASVQARPVIIGLWWWTGMMRTDADGFIHPTGIREGGHEVAAIGHATRQGYFTILNSWGPEWGHYGRARIHETDLHELLDDDGDMTVLTR